MLRICIFRFCSALGNLQVCRSYRNRYSTLNKIAGKMASFLGGQQKKHKVTIVGSGNWYVGDLAVPMPIPMPLAFRSASNKLVLGVRPLPKSLPRIHESTRMSSRKMCRCGCTRRTSPSPRRRSTTMRPWARPPRSSRTSSTNTTKT